eukprot:m.412233 g.412233  ORF g.412233 m.412233 type:complete len:489 (+) comp21251_c0_seq2:215-1681(+)
MSAIALMVCMLVCRIPSVCAQTSSIDNIDPLPSGDVAYLSASYDADPSMVERRTDVSILSWNFTGVYLSYSMNRTITDTSLTLIDVGCNFTNISGEVWRAIEGTIVLLPEMNCSVVQLVTSIHEVGGLGILFMSSAPMASLVNQIKSVWYPTYASTNAFHMIMVAIEHNASVHLASMLLSNAAMKVSISPTAPNSTSYSNEKDSSGDNTFLQWAKIAGSFFAGLAILAIIVAVVSHFRRRYVRNHYIARLAEREHGPLHVSLSRAGMLEPTSMPSETSPHCLHLQKQRARALLSTLRTLEYVRPSQHSTGFAKEFNRHGSSDAFPISTQESPGPPLPAWNEHAQKKSSQVPAERVAFRTSASNITVEHPHCVICLSVFAHGDLLMEMPCSHLYHAACVTPWLEEHRECPLCKQDVYALQYSALMATPSATHGSVHGMIFDGEDTLHDSGSEIHATIPGEVQDIGILYLDDLVNVDGEPNAPVFSHTFL